MLCGVGDEKEGDCLARARERIGRKEQGEISGGKGERERCGGVSTKTGINMSPSGPRRDSRPARFFRVLVTSHSDLVVGGDADDDACSFAAVVVVVVFGVNNGSRSPTIVLCLAAEG